MREIWPPPGFDPRTDDAIPAHIIIEYIPKSVNPLVFVMETKHDPVRGLYVIPSRTSKTAGCHLQEALNRHIPEEEGVLSRLKQTERVYCEVGTEFD